MTSSRAAGLLIFLGGVLLILAWFVPISAIAGGGRTLEGVRGTT